MELYRPPQKNPREDATTQAQISNEQLNENIYPNKCIIPMYPEDTDSKSSVQVTPKNNSNLQNVINNQLRQASNMFQNATFHNCNFSFNLPN